MARCDRPDCGRGEIDYQGYCTSCSRRPLSSSPAPDGGGGRAMAGGEGGEAAAGGAWAGGTAAGGAAAGGAALPAVGQVRQEPWWGLELVADGSPPPEPDDPAGDDGPVPEERRFCKACGQPVGRGHAGRPGRVAGFCPHDLTPFDFARSRAGELIAGRYEVRRTLGAGGFGEALLAYDRNLGTEVVLKDLRGAQGVAETARQERAALVGLRHESIVRIYGYEQERPYLVLEYVPGTPLSARADDRLEVILAHGLRLLQALDYLHARGLLHIDVKPSNIIRFPEKGAEGPRDRVRLIDFGAVRAMGKPGPPESYTMVYAPPKSDPEHAGPTAGFDLFCLGSTLRELCGSYLIADPAPPGVPALGRLLDRATDTRTPARRFVSARQFSEQLSGVIRQVVAAPAPAVGGGAPRAGRWVSRPSAIFGSMTSPLHGGLGEPRPLGHWIKARVSEDKGITLPAPFTAPTPADAIAALPAPLADPDDPAHTSACEARLAACRAALRNGDPDSAGETLGTAGLPDWSWIRAWYAGLIALAHGDAASAARYFSTTHDGLAGELIPALALGICAEIRGDLVQARQRYKLVADTAPALSAAAFGLARTCLRDGQRAAAVTAARRLAAELQSRELRSENEARIAEVRLIAAVTQSAQPAGRDLEQPTEADLKAAERLVAGLPVSVAVRSRLHAEILYGRARITGDWLGLSAAIPGLAEHAGTKSDFFAMIDLANRLRPPVRWWWDRDFRKNRDTSAV